MGLGCIAYSLPSPEQHRTPVEDPVASEDGADRLNKMLYKRALAGSVWAHNNDEETTGLQPSPNAPHAVGKQVGYQPQWISDKARLPRFGPDLRKERIHTPPGACLDHSCAQFTEEELTG